MIPFRLVKNASPFFFFFLFFLFVKNDSFHNCDGGKKLLNATIKSLISDSLQLMTGNKYDIATDKFNKPVSIDFCEITHTIQNKTKLQTGKILYKGREIGKAMDILYHFIHHL